MVRRIDDQVAFLLEADRLKSVLRRTTLADGSRRENSAEHSWHLALFAIALHEHAEGDVDLLRVLKMLVLHDLVEIDAGDTFAYDEVGRADQQERERRAADRIFGFLPTDQEMELRALWDEFDLRETDDARFAAAVDRLQPVLLNLASDGDTWLEHGIHAEQVRERNAHVADGAPALWGLVQDSIETAVDNGWLR